MKSLVDPFLAYLLVQVAGLLVAQRRAVGQVRGMLGALLCVTLLLAIFSTPLLREGLEASLAVSSVSGDSRPPHFVVVLAGGYVPGITKDRDTLNPESRRRLLEGIEVWRRFPEAKLVLTGATEFQNRQSNRHAQLMGEAAMDEGVPVSAVLLEPRSRNTRAHPVEISALPGMTAATPITVVTTGWHMRRARREFCRYFQYVQAHAVPEIEDEGGLRHLIPGAGVLSTNTVLLREWVGIIWYTVTQPPWLRQGVAESNRCVRQ